MRKISGLALIMIGLLHSLIALVMPGAIGFSDIWQEIVNVGVFDAVSVNSLRIWGYYWFLMTGFLVILYGFLCYWIENQLSQTLPLFVGLGLLAVAGFGIVLDIDTGCWLILVVAVNAIAASQRPHPSHKLGIESSEKRT
ncbi:hypothetical protein IQ241_17540 [Romeria aff. gracilis LEGE 07310]|uniref:Uncharacterized protein n=1 Tax=Vasconcelosia minhoensis LEGE 07310 TaxID=915328 RepID=A0A8J7AHK1_9CYAN|nr:DUF6463 family protein [Romeria gracilis]MBE9079079.1 hypothetical protein [Romeria aff. gracilis LEGE 07310]